MTRRRFIPSAAAGDVVSVYYGAGDSVVGLATASLDGLLACVRREAGSRNHRASAIVDAR